MNEVIEKLKKDFQASVPKEETELVQAFEDYLHFAVETIQNNDKPFIQKDEASIQRTLEYLTKTFLENDLDMKKKRLLKDENMEIIGCSSSRAYNMALKVLEGEPVEEQIDLKKEEKELKSALQKVAPYNQEEAKRLVSETMLDYQYVKDPTAELVSLRMGREMMDKKRREEAKNQPKEI